MSEATSSRISEAVEVLERTPGVLRALCAGLSAGWTEAVDTVEEGWNAQIVLGHLIHGEETDWIPRLRIILTEGSSRVFEPFDRQAQNQRFSGWPISRLLDRFAAARRESLEALSGLLPDDAALAAEGRHPELGQVTAGQLLATWTAHDLSHIAQIARAMARRYRGEVGPWRAFLSLLR